MRRFSNDQKDLFFLSPYTDILFQKNTMIIKQRLFGLDDCLVISSSMTERLLSGLAKGVSKEILYSELIEAGIEQPEDVIVRWMQMGILE